MDAKRMPLGRDVEVEILDCIVDAMLEAEVQLHEASVEQWREILLKSCRRGKERVASRQDCPATIPMGRRHSAVGGSPQLAREEDRTVPIGA